MTPGLKWGRDNEDRARNEYIKFTNGKHNNLVVRPSGLVIHPNYPLLGASPDGFVCCDCCESRVLDIKCPFKYPATSPTADKPLSDPNFCLQKNAKGDVALYLQGHLIFKNATFSNNHNIQNHLKIAPSNG